MDLVVRVHRSKKPRKSTWKTSILRIKKNIIKKFTFYLSYLCVKKHICIFWLNENVLFYALTFMERQAISKNLCSFVSYSLHYLKSKIRDKKILIEIILEIGKISTLFEPEGQNGHTLSKLIFPSNRLAVVKCSFVSFNII